MQKVIRVEIAGGAGSGKTTMVQMVKEELEKKDASVIINYRENTNSILGRGKRIGRIMLNMIKDIKVSKGLFAIAILCLKKAYKANVVERAFSAYAINFYRYHNMQIQLQDQASFYQLKKLEKSMTERDFNELLERMILPDLIVLLDVSEETKFRRKALRKKEEKIKYDRGTDALVTKYSEMTGLYKTNGYANDEIKEILSSYHKKVENIHMSDEDLLEIVIKAKERKPLEQIAKEKRLLQRIACKRKTATLLLDNETDEMANRNATKICKWIATYIDSGS
ncbi:nucleoside/nucleotide kinase family protein [Tindallia californiensis]|uniref:Thymidylate kinase n=1 Tax=Tindallia californiensis TaxID=159292 RepID=A0A1H3PB96_9FIRM|nr:hypothetical protein [Tindallia californiensis]SDY98406.1 Thymidylate kinase [Tindallia californiensis]